MNKIMVVIIIVAFFLLGIIYGSGVKENDDLILQKEIEQFENDITTPNNDYEAHFTFPDNSVSKVGQKGEQVIDKVFEFCFSFVKKIIDS